MDRGVSTIEARIADTAGLRLDRALADALPTISRERLKALISTGAVTDDEGVLRLLLGAPNVDQGAVDGGGLTALDLAMQNEAAAALRVLQNMETS